MSLKRSQVGPFAAEGTWRTIEMLNSETVLRAEPTLNALGQVREPMHLCLGQLPLRAGNIEKTWEVRGLELHEEVCVAIRSEVLSQRQSKDGWSSDP